MIDLPADALLEECLMLMSEHQICSVPVYTKSQDESKTYFGIVSISDILAKTVFLYYRSFLSTRDAHSGKQAEDQIPIQELETFKKTPLDQLLGLANEGIKWAEVSSSQPLFSLLHAFTKSGLHRVLVRLDSHDFPAKVEKKKKYRIVSQSDLIDIIYQKFFAEFSAATYGTMTISQVIDAHPNRHVVKLNDGQTALACFKVCDLFSYH
jgi:CBS-domain-containing membrane protein